MAKTSAAATVTVTSSCAAILALFLITLTQSAPVNCAPTPSEEVNNNTANASTTADPASASTTAVEIDPVWSMITGAKISDSFTYNYEIQTPLVEPGNELLTGIFIEKDEPLPIVLQGLCDLLSFYVLLPKTNDLYLLLTQNIVDSSNWLNYLVTDDINVSGSGVLPETCAPNDTSLLYQYCLRKKLEVSGEDVLNELLNVKITNGLIDYHLDRPIVSTSDQCQWLQTNFISTVETRIKMRASRVDACNMRQLVL